MKRRGFVVSLIAGFMVGFRGPRQVWDISVQGHNEEFMALGFRGVAVDGRRVSASRIDLARGEVVVLARDAEGKVYVRDGKLVREVLRGRIELLLEKAESVREVAA